MAVIFADSASLYDSIATAATAKNYSVYLSGAGAILYRQAGAWGAGSFSLQIKSDGATVSGAVTGSVPAATTYTLGFRWKSTAAGSASSQSSSTIAYLLNSGVNTHCLELGCDTTSHIVVINRLSSTAILTSTSTLTVTNWNYIEFQATADTTNCSATLWFNGVQVGTTSTGGSCGATTFDTFGFGPYYVVNGVNNLQYNVANPGMTMNYADIYLTDTTNASGAGNTGALGPVRVEFDLPTGAGTTTTWTPVGVSACSANQFNPTATTGFVADTSCTITNAATNISTLATYVSDFGITSSLEQQGTAIPAIVTTSAGTSGFAVTPGNYYTASLLAFPQNNSPNFAIGIRWYTSGGATIQTDFGPTVLGVNPVVWNVMGFTAVAPATAAFAAIVFEQVSGSQTNIYLTGWTFMPAPYSTFTGPIIKPPSLTATNWVNASEPVAGTMFNRDAGATGVGDIDSFAMADLITAAGTPLAVIATVIASKENTNPRSIAPLLRVSGTNYPATGVALNNDMAYHAFPNVWELNPNGSVAWTISTVNGIEAGVEITA